MSIVTLLDSLAECYTSGAQLREPDLRSRIGGHVAALARLSGSELASRGAALGESVQKFRRIRWAVLMASQNQPACLKSGPSKLVE